MVATTDALDIINDVSRLLYDEDNTVYADHVLLGFLNAAQLEAATLNPRVNTVAITHQLTAGISQSLPVDGIMLVDVNYNRGNNGSTIGKSITRINRDVLNKRVPDWPNEAANGIVKAYIYEDTNPNVFYVYPGQPVTPYYVELVYSKRPTTIADSNIGTKITVDDKWRNALMNYCVYRCYVEQSEYGNNAEKRNHHYQQFLGALGITASEAAQRGITPSFRSG